MWTLKRLRTILEGSEDNLADNHSLIENIFKLIMSRPINLLLSIVTTHQCIQTSAANTDIAECLHTESWVFVYIL